MEPENNHFELVVCGAGLAGFAAAVSAARAGIDVCLVQDRPVLGGNSSSEIRVSPRGASTYHAYAREGGVLAELMASERMRNHEPIFENGWTNSVWDLALYDMAVRTKNLTLMLNTSVRSVTVQDGRIVSATCWTAAAETETEVHGEIFVDSTGDGVIAVLAGCEFRNGEEARSEFDEPHAPLTSSPDTMGNSLHFKTKDVGRPVSFELPDWAVEYDDPEFFYKQGRVPNDVRGGYWWIELGKPWDTITDSEKIRHELTRHTLGVWDWIKNKDPRTREKTKNLALDWLGQVPGTRESRRIMGLHLMTEHDLFREEPFEDEVAYGGWNIDLHTPGGLLAPTSEPTAAAGYNLRSEESVRAYVGPFGIPLRSLIAKDVTNLMMAGRNISATHVALGSVRVQATTATMGQAVGTAAALALSRDVALHDLPFSHASDVQQQLLKDGCFLPHVINKDPEDLARHAEVSASSDAPYLGASPGDTWVAGGLREGGRQREDHLTSLRGQWFPVETGADAPGLSSVRVRLRNHGSSPVSIPAVLSQVEHIWDYRVDTDMALEKTVLEVEPGEHWVTWDVAIDPARLRHGEPGGQYLRLDLSASPDVEWIPAGRILPGAVSAFEMTPGRMRRFGAGVTLSHRIEPAQHAYPAMSVISGTARPHNAPNAWRSDPGHPLEQWLQLDWHEPQEIGSIHLSFAGNLLREYDQTPEMWSDPQTVRDYCILAKTETGWHEVVAQTGNGLPRRVHELPHAVTTTALRLVVQATNGDPSAAVYEVRCYGPDQ
ncbi:MULTISPECIES: FAD-dependent oxidoreductase [unclassified Brachybacterium]|uniref:FAD-dependent oxidoreductase n=1 Tax=unclassified Brachybacterium TaxID=2623841 RepID=UPI003FB71CB3